MNQVRVHGNIFLWDREESCFIGNLKLQYEMRGSGYTINEEQRKQQVSQNLTAQRETLKSIKMIKSPMFFSKFDERNSSLSNTDTDDLSSPRIELKSTATNIQQNVSGEKNNEMNYPDGDNIQRLKPTIRNVQIRAMTSYKRPL